ncbi:MAG: glycosyltransferase, partial [Chloroflexi bacterium]|nr:glycosyltransferase [Chloroflexota bacterium]
AYRAELRRLAGRYGAEDRLRFYPQVDHDDLIASLGDFEVGLALERSDHLNRDLTVSNKVFSYLLAGLAVAATDTLGQGEVLERAPGAGFLYPAGDVDELVRRLEDWVRERDRLRSAQQAAWTVAREWFNWDAQAEHFLRLLRTRSGVGAGAGGGGMG